MSPSPTLDQYISAIAIIIISVLSIILNILLAISNIKLKTPNKIIKIFTIQILIASSLGGVYLSFFALFHLKIFTTADCSIIVILRNYFFVPLTLSALFIAFSTFITFTNNHLIVQYKLCFTIIPSFIIWSAPLATLLFVVICPAEKYDDVTCKINDPALYGTISRWTLLVIEVITGVIWIVLICILYRFKGSNEEALLKAKKNLILKFGIYIAVIIVFEILYRLSIGSFSLDEDLFNILKYYFSLVLSLYNLFFVYVFVWTKALKTVFVEMFCCSKKKDESEKNIMKNIDEIEESDGMYI